MFPGRYFNRRGLVGDRNIAFALQRLAAEGVQVSASHVAGEGHREVIFEVWSGDVWVRHSPAPATEGWT
jgi:chemotaxis protein CheD